jgi:hypothetical protein
MRTVPDTGSVAYCEMAIKSRVMGTLIWRTRSAIKNTTPLNTPHHQGSRPA